MIVKPAQKADQMMDLCLKYVLREGTIFVTFKITSERNPIKKLTIVNMTSLKPNRFVMFFGVDILNVEMILLNCACTTFGKSCAKLPLEKVELLNCACATCIT